MALVRRLGRIPYSLALDLQLQLIAKYKDSNRGEVSKYTLSVSRYLETWCLENHDGIFEYLPLMYAGW